GTGGGIFSGETLKLKKCTFRGNMATNTAGDGGGAILAAGTPTDAVVTAINCIFEQKTAASSGGALQSKGRALLAGCLFDHNSAADGGAIFTETVALHRCTVANNTASNTCGGITLKSKIFSFANSIIWGNSDRSPTLPMAQ